MSMDRKLWTEVRAIAARRDPEGADDLAQDLSLAALERSAGVARPGAWLERVGRNALIDRWRAARRREALAVEIEAPSAPADPEAALLARERRGLVRRALVALPRPQRRAALARFHGELAFDDVATRLGTQEVTARTRVHRALASLRSRLTGLRALFVLPGAQTAALGLTLLAVEAPGLAPPARVVTAEAPAPLPSRTRHFARTRLIAAEASPASAAAPARKPRPLPATPPPIDEIPPPRTFVFGEDTVEGDVSGPEGEEIVIVPPATHSSLIELRRHFVAEVAKTMEDL
jgi:RNA polymerase sigma-70 factor (ECF subfamily)